MGGGLRLDNRQRSSDNLRALFSILFSRCLALGIWDGESPVEKMAPKRKCKFNDDWWRDVAWIAKLPDNGMAQCNLCDGLFDIVWWSHGCSPAPRECTLSWRRRRVGKGSTKHSWSPYSSSKGGMVQYVAHGHMDWVDGVTRAETMFAYWIAHHSSLGRPN